MASKGLLHKVAKVSCASCKRPLHHTCHMPLVRQASKQACLGVQQRKVGVHTKAAVLCCAVVSCALACMLGCTACAGLTGWASLDRPSQVCLFPVHKLTGCGSVGVLSSMRVRCSKCKHARQVLTVACVRWQRAAAPSPAGLVSP